MLKVCQVNIPFNNPITGFCVRKFSVARMHSHGLTAACRLSLIRLAFMRKPFSRVRPSSTTNISKVLIGIDPSTYEIINPADFGINRYVHFANRLTGKLKHTKFK